MLVRVEFAIVLAAVFTACALVSFSVSMSVRVSRE